MFYTFCPPHLHFCLKGVSAATAKAKCPLHVLRHMDCTWIGRATLGNRSVLDSAGLGESWDCHTTGKPNDPSARIDQLMGRQSFVNDFLIKIRDSPSAPATKCWKQMILVVPFYESLRTSWTLAVDVWIIPELWDLAFNQAAWHVRDDSRQVLNSGNFDVMTLVTKCLRYAQWSFMWSYCDQASPRMSSQSQGCWCCEKTLRLKSSRASLRIWVGNTNNEVP